MWVVYAFLSAFCVTAKDVIGKSTSQKTNIYVTAFSVHFFGILILLPLVMLSGIPNLSLRYWVAVLAACFTIPSAAILYMYAIKSSPLSVTLPMLSFTPVFTAFLSIFFDKKLPDLLGWIGIIIICSGLYLSRLSRKTFQSGFFYPFYSLTKDLGVLAMLGVAIIWSIGSHVSKMTVVNSSPLFSALSFSVIGSVLLFIIGRIYGQLTLKLIKSQIFRLGQLGIFNALSEIAMNSALALGYTPYVISIKRSSILWSSLLGKLLHNDEFSFFKIIGLLLMFMGIILILI